MSQAIFVELATKENPPVLKTELKSAMQELKIALEKLNQKCNFIIILLIIALTLMNPVAAGIIQDFLKLPRMSQ